ncbi:hypothetical protein NJI34_05600 [Pseudomonas sp. S 311-6]|uniref:hypothetical protein n=1 Tax=Pseudomonas TaxID=286 RepID=UPI00209734BD|nr:MULTISPECIES: hypothetical protein [Pseudomonas]MCO7563893.1 hypothetical protein [Pseudomonas mosselii]MCO7615301.1 hypothetical protein [Pseudomonas guariconensis]MCO7636264.1 hypothetical protein [Pseudomonas sp. S 311-6]
MTTQQVVALFVICLFIIGLFAYAYFLGRKAGRAHHQTGSLFDSPPCAGHSRPTSVSLQISASEGSGHDVAQAIRDAIPASLREASSIDAQKTKSLCCEAAGIIHPFSSPAEALIPHDKLREAAPVDATLIAKNRPHAQPAEGYTHPSAVSCIVAAMDATPAEAGTYATSEQMAQAIEAALQQAGFLSPTDETWEVVRAHLDESLIERKAEQRKHHHTAANLKRTIAELEERIMSYTGMPVTRADYDLLISAAESLKLAEKTWKALPGTEPGRKRATQHQQDILALAMRVHSQLRNTPAGAVSAGEAA